MEKKKIGPSFLHRQRQRDTERQKNRDKDRKTDRDKDRETDRDKDRETDRNRETQRQSLPTYPWGLGPVASCPASLESPDRCRGSEGT